jgi:hypothetical protein
MATAYLQKLCLFSRDVRLYLITAVLVGFSWMGVYAVLFNLYLLRLGYDLEFVGLVNAVAMLAYAVFSLPGGALGGRLGVRRVMIAGLSLGVAGLVLPPLAELLPTALRAGWLLATYSLGYIGAAAYLVNATVFLMGATSQMERSYVFSMQVALWPLSAFAGSLVGGQLPEFFATVARVSVKYPNPYRYSLLVAALLFMPSVPVLMATRKIGVVDTQETASEAGLAPYGLIATLALVQLLQGAGEGATRTFFNVYLDAGLRVATQRIGTMAAVGQLLAVPAALATPLLIARWGNGRTFTWSSLGMAISLLPLALVPHWWAAGIGFAGVMTLGSVWRPAFIVRRMEVVSPAWWALMNGASNMALGLSWSAMSLGGGYVVTALGYRSLFLTGAAVTAAGALLFGIYFRVPRGELARRSASGTAD